MIPTTTTYACDYRENTFWGSVELTLCPDGRLSMCQLIACWTPEGEEADSPLRGYHRTIMTLTYRPRHQDLIFISTVLPYDEEPIRQEWPPLSAVTEERLALRTVVNGLRYLKKAKQYPFASRAERGQFVHFLMNPRRRPPAAVE